MVATAYGFAPYHPTPHEKQARILAAKRAASRDHSVACVLGILTARSVAAALPAGLKAAAPRSENAAQGVGPGLPWLASRVAAGRTKGQGAESPALTSAPAGVPGGSGSRGAAPFYAGPANGGSQEGDLAMIAGRHLGRGASVQERG